MRIADYVPKFSIARMFNIVILFGVFFAMWHYWGSTVAIVGFYLLIPYAIGVLLKWSK